MQTESETSPLFGRARSVQRICTYQTGQWRAVCLFLCLELSFCEKLRTFRRCFNIYIVLIKENVRHCVESILQRKQTHHASHCARFAAWSYVWCELNYMSDVVPNVVLSLAVTPIIPTHTDRRQLSPKQRFENPRLRNRLGFSLSSTRLAVQSHTSATSLDINWIYIFRAHIYYRNPKARI